MGNDVADQTFCEVMTVDPPPATTPLELATREFVFGDEPAALSWSVP
jgi:4-carboxymuconolactone decarboxylase